MTETKTDKWCIGSNEEEFDSEIYNSREEAIAEGREFYEDGFYIGKNIKIEVDENDADGCLDSLIDQLQNDDHCGEYAENWLEDITPEHRKEFNKMVVDWFNRNGYQPNFFMVEEVEKIEWVPEDV